MKLGLVGLGLSTVIFVFLFISGDYGNLEQYVLITESDPETREIPEPQVKGWPPCQSRDLGLYIRPNETTTLMLPKNEAEDVEWRGKRYPKSFILVCVHSSTDSFEKRMQIRQSWAKDQIALPIKVIFLIGKAQDDEHLEAEGQIFQDVLQEDLVDSYANLTLKSVLMLKYAQTLDNVSFLMKVDDDSFVNLFRLMVYVSILERHKNDKFIVGHVLGPGSPVIRPQKGQVYSTGWEVPFYIYNQTSFPNAVSGSGYLISRPAIPCLYEKSLDIPYLNLEDIFVTGLAASKCRVRLKNSQWFFYLGKDSSLVKPQDILIHGLKQKGQMVELYKKLHKL